MKRSSRRSLKCVVEGKIRIGHDITKGKNLRQGLTLVKHRKRAGIAGERRLGKRLEESSDSQTGRGEGKG
jgi:hypothetical protein